MANSNSQNVVSWQPHGKAFRVHQPEDFARTIMRRYFNQTQYKSFQRQLHIYGFRRIKKGRDLGGYYHSLFSRNRKSMSLRMTREEIKGLAGKKNHGHEEIEAPDFYKEMLIMEDHYLPAYCSEKRDFATLLAKPLPILADLSGVMTAAKSTYRSGDGGRLDPWWLDLGEQTVSFSSLKTKNACCNSQLSTGNVASVVVKEHIEDGDEVFFEGNKFYFMGPSEPTSTVVDFLATVTARGPFACMPKCA
jgi:hypothetical protein